MNLTPTLSKSDFKLASDCPQKLLYKKAKYPNSNDENEFLQILAEGGYIVGKMAQVMYEQFAKENGYACKEITSDRNSKQAIQETEELLIENEKIILFEPAIATGQMLVRIDVLIKTKNHFEILEVKAKSHESIDEDDEKSTTNQKKKLREYIEDVAYQKMVLTQFLKAHETLFPDSTIDANLLMPNKSNTTQIENLASWFEITDRIKIGDFNSIEVAFNKQGKEKELWENGNSILQIFKVNDDVDKMTEEIKNRTELYLKYLNKVEAPIIADLISKKCFACEFKNPDDKNKDGYYQCLSARAYTENHISELYYGGTVGGNKNPLVNDKLKTNKALSIFDYDIKDFVTTKGEIGSRNERQIIQYENTSAKTEYFSEDLKDELSGWKYPLHFIDFETLTCAIPHHKGMRPYETIGFQWSCHTIEKPGDAPIHSEWINTETTFPNFRFAESLMKQIGETGTPLMWATHENTVLRTILEQLENVDNYVDGYKNEQLKTWLINITKESDKKANPRPGRLIDMNAITLKHYFHPYMKGKTSIKKTLPATWNFNKYLHEVSYFKQYFKQDESGNILSPYETLKNRWDELEFETAENYETVKEGSGAMRAYQEMLFGKGKTDADKKERLKQELLNYCELDTMAMVIIWYHWKTHFGLV
ncbi:MAG: DUF2779 domain-containing protein [Chitinophagales bacterium]